MGGGEMWSLRRQTFGEGSAGVLIEIEDAQNERGGGASRRRGWGGGEHRNTRYCAIEQGGEQAFGQHVLRRKKEDAEEDAVDLGLQTIQKS